MAGKRLPRGLKKHIRQEKSRIRREVLDEKERKRQIEGLYPLATEKSN